MTIDKMPFLRSMKKRLAIQKFNVPIVKNCNNQGLKFGWPRFFQKNKMSHFYITHRVCILLQFCARFRFGWPTTRADAVRLCSLLCTVSLFLNPLSVLTGRDLLLALLEGWHTGMPSVVVPCCWHLLGSARHYAPEARLHTQTTAASEQTPETNSTTDRNIKSQ